MAKTQITLARPIRRKLLLAALPIAAGLVIVAGPSTASAGAPGIAWQSGMRAVSNGATVEPAVNDVDGTQTFLMTPNNSPFYATGVTPGPIPPSFLHASAPLYLVTYPMGSTVDTVAGAAPLNCYTAGAYDSTATYNCDHAQIPGMKGHDHLVGVPGTQKAGGDYNVAWHVFVTFFTAQGMTGLNGKPAAMNTRILTLNALRAAQARGDVTQDIDTGVYFNCSAVSSASYQHATPLSFPPFPSS